MIGSEMSGGVRNVWVTDSEFVGTDRGLRIITSFYATSTLVPLTSAPPALQNIHIKNIAERGAKQAIDISFKSTVLARRAGPSFRLKIVARLPIPNEFLSGPAV